MSPSLRARARIGIAATAASLVVVGLALAAPAQAAGSSVPTGTKATHAATQVGTGSAKAPTKASKGNKASKASKYVPAACATPKKVSATSAKAGVPQATCYALGKAGADGKTVTAQDAPPATALGPAQIQDAYDLPATGSGMTVAIVDAYGYDNAEADLQVFRNYYGLPACTTANGCFTKLDQRGGTDYPAQDAGWSVETALDLDAVSSACPQCNIVLLQGDSASIDDLGAAVVTASQLPGVVAISNSYGVPGEGSDEADYDHYYDHPGIAVTVSTGDDGWLTSWPATSPTAVAVGGTSLTSDSSARGWTESAWDGAGSGCSLYEPKPDFQSELDTQCDNRAIADISADADPATGIGIYNTLGESGWAQYGGTSLSAPLVAAMYAVAGTPTPGTYPNSYPYTDVSRSSDFNDVTSGSNGSCGNLLCNGAPGWDGPTGLGTPHGVAGLTQGAHGTIAGTVTSAGSALAGVTITATDADGTDFSATSSATGDYTLAVPIGTYSVTATKFGYRSQTQDGVEVAEDATVTEDFALDAIPSHTVSGVVSDGSGHGWPMYAKVTVDGLDGSTYTNPFTGKYSLSLPEGEDYSLHVSSASLTGYQDADQDVTVGTTNVKANIDLPVDTYTCTAAGYQVSSEHGSATDFEGWTGTTPQDGWTIADDGGASWEFDDPGHRGNRTGGSGNFAIVDSDHAGSGNAQDTSLVSPVLDLSDNPHPEIMFNTYYDGYYEGSGDVDVTTDGGATWTNVWHQTTSTVSGPQEVPLPTAGGKSAVQVRFHYTASYAWYWELDDVAIGAKHCDPVDGALVGGLVKDANTKSGLAGAKVGVDGDATEFGVSAATPDDAALADGFYELFTKQADQNADGKVALTVTDGKYTPASAKVAVIDDDIAQKNWNLKAGHLTVSGDVSITEQLGVSKSKPVTFTNDGSEPVHVKLSEGGSGFTPMAGSGAAGAPSIKIKADAYVGDQAARAKSIGKSGARSGASPARSVVAGADWTSVADLPEPLADEAAVTVDGKVYSFGGFNGADDVKKTYIYDPDAGSWSRGADLPETLEAARAVSIGGLIYVVGGWDASAQENTHVYVYDPAADSWSTAGGTAPVGVAAPGVAVDDGKIFVVGGCTDAQNCAPLNKPVQIYDPEADSWSTGADYPATVAFPSCGAFDGQVYCAGGVDASTGAGVTGTYSYDPGSDGWAQRAPMPAGHWGAAIATANGKLQIAQGISNGNVVNSAVEYDPSADTWAPLPNANAAVFRGAGACGMYSIGGGDGFEQLSGVEELPGYDSCATGGADVSWLSTDTSEFDVAPGASVTVTVTADSTAVDQPGTYTAALSVATDSPYRIPAVGVTMTVNPPASWAKITGTVTGGGAALKGATVQICTMYIPRTGLCGPVTYTLSTDADGKYQLWLAAGYTPLQVIAAKDGYQPKMAIAKLTKGATTTTNFALLKK